MFRETDLKPSGVGVFALVALSKIQRDRVDAVALVRGRRAVIEDMAEVPVAAGAKNFRAHHEEAPIRLRAHGTLLRRRVEARPTGTGVEFGPGIEELIATAGANIGAILLAIPILARESALGALLA